MAAPFARVGIVAKARLTEAAATVAELTTWLQGRGIEPVFDTDTAALPSIPGRHHRVVDRDELPKHCDLLVVLGGDGTLIGMAGRVANAAANIPQGSTSAASVF
jgi:NAD+ kinase